MQFDELWSSVSPIKPLSSVMRDLAKVNAESKRNAVQIRYLLSLNHVEEANNRLLQLFQSDLMPYAVSLVVDAKQRRELDERPEPVAKWKKIISSVYILASNIAIMFYIFLFSIKQQGVMQRNWLQSLVVWLLLDILVLSTATTYIANIYLPLLFASEIRLARDEANAIATANTASNVAFNACKYMFVSYKVAEAFPDLTASNAILRYSSPWPRRSYRTSVSPRGIFVLLVLYALRAVVELPPSIQDEVCKGLMQLISLNAYFAVNQFGLEDQVSVFLILALISGVLYLVHLMIRLLSTKRLGPTSTTYEDSAMLKPRSALLLDRRSSLQLGVDAMVAIQNEMEARKQNASAKTITAIASDDDLFENFSSNEESDSFESSSTEAQRMSINALNISSSYSDSSDSLSI